MGAPPTDSVGDRQIRLLSREAEMTRLRGFVTGQGRSDCMVLVAEPGMGKTTLWEESLTIARNAGATVLWARASAAEMSLSFAALNDLVEGTDREILERLPAPQRHGIEVAVRRADPDGATPDPLAISAGFLGAIRLLASRQPLVIGIDDAQWLDQSSEDVLAFAARRQTSEPIRFLLARRPHQVSKLEQGFRRDGVERLELTGLSFGAIGRLLVKRLGLTVPRRVLRQLYTTAQGNPLVALELGRQLAEREPFDHGDELPIPVLDEDVFGARVRGLPPTLGRALLAVALSGGLSRSDLGTLVDPDVVEEGVSSGLLAVERDRVRPSHPLLAAAARHQASARQLEGLHRDLSTAAGDPLLRALHLAAATAEPDEEVSGIVAVATRLATEHAAVDQAEDLARQALRLTTPDSPEYPDRLFMLARCHLAVGDPGSARSLLASHLDRLPPGPVRARGHILLGVASDVQGEVAQLDLAERALGGIDAAPEIRADIRSRRAVVFTVNLVRSVDRAEEWAREAVAAARQCGPEVTARARVALGWTLALQGKAFEEPQTQAPLAAGWGLQDSVIDRPNGVRAVFRGEVQTARRIFQAVLDQTESGGEFRALFTIRIQLCEMELRRGAVNDALAGLESLTEWVTFEELAILNARVWAIVAALRGETTEVSRWADVVLGAREELLQEWDRLEAKRACGISALYEGDAQRAVELLRGIWDHTQREHVDDPGAFPVAGDLVEALALDGDTESARAVAERLLELAMEQDHPWGLAMAKRCDALLRLRDGYRDDAIKVLEEAARAFEDLELDFDASRTHLLLGRIQRQFKKNGAARRSLEQAAAGFETLGCTGWADQARRELARIGGRRPITNSQLTPSEQRVAALAAEGFSNKEIAAQLVVSVNTVENHLSKVYAKLGVRSRSQLGSQSPSVD